ncbi:MAG TPA: TSUP family transporter, partial [Verrucomicrobiaceae bacterium]
MTWTTLASLFFAGLGAGFIDSIAGGGGLISIPALLAAGLPPQIALGTNKFQSTWGTLVAVTRYARAGMMRTPWLWLAVVTAFPASVCGAYLVTIASNEILKKIIPWMLAVVAVYAALHPRVGVHPARQKLSPALFAPLFGAGLGLYDGFFGPGVGTFGTIACIAALGLDFRHATGYTKAANLASNLSALT